MLEGGVQALIDRLAHLFEFGGVLALQLAQLGLEGVADLGEPRLVGLGELGELRGEAVDLAILHGGDPRHLRRERLAEIVEAAGELGTLRAADLAEVAPHAPDLLAQLAAAAVDRLERRRVLHQGPRAEQQHRETDEGQDQEHDDGDQQVVGGHAGLGRRRGVG